jgi:hypothetical protein
VRRNRPRSRRASRRYPDEKNEAIFTKNARRRAERIRGYTAPHRRPRIARSPTQPKTAPQPDAQFNVELIWSARAVPCRSRPRLLTAYWYKDGANSHFGRVNTTRDFLFQVRTSRAERRNPRWLTRGPHVGWGRCAVDDGWGRAPCADGTVA